MRRAWLLCLLPLAACRIFADQRVEATPVAWRPLVLAHVAHPEPDRPGGAARLAAAAAALGTERYLDAVVVSGRLGGDPARLRAALAPSGRPVVVVGPAAPAPEWVEPFRDLAILAVPQTAAAAAAEALRHADRRLRGRWGCAALGWEPGEPGGAAAETRLAYALEAVGRIRAVLVPAAVSDVRRRAGLVTLLTEPLSGGVVRLVEVDGFRLRTWLRTIAAAEGGRDGPATRVRTR